MFSRLQGCIMSSENIEALKTNEFHKRRKLRLLQVREQSKDIAKKIRTKAKNENARYLKHLDARKSKEHFRNQEKVVKHLEDIYSDQMKQVGSSHRSATFVNQKEHQPEKLDMSKERGRAAAARLRQKKQEELDQKKILLERKLRAKVAANELSRDKSSGIINKFNEKAEVPKESVETQTEKITSEVQSTVQFGDDTSKEQMENKEDKDASKENEDRQWNAQHLPSEWEPSVPKLILRKCDKEVSSDMNPAASQMTTERTKKSNLFAISEEMPSSLCGGLSRFTPQPNLSTKSSLNLVSEYLQSRHMRLREHRVIPSKPIENIESIRETLFHARAISSKGSDLNNICHVNDNELIPMPTWKAEDNITEPSHNLSENKFVPGIEQQQSLCLLLKPRFNSVTEESKLISKRIDKKNITSSNRGHNVNMSAKPVSTGQTKTSGSAGSVARNLVTIYNHTTRDIQDVPLSPEKIVIREAQHDEDAYSQALKESSNSEGDRVHLNKVQGTRSRVAMSKQDVEKEYKDTIAFLNSLPKDKQVRSLRKAYMDQHQQNEQKEIRQRRMQQEYQKIEKECKKQAAMAGRPTFTKIGDGKNVMDDDSELNVAESTKEQYSWIPSPEGDVSFTVHKIPNEMEKTPNNKHHISNGYHEYRSRHKHTPPTKDMAAHINNRQSRVVIKNQNVDKDAECSSEDDFYQDDSERQNIPTNKQKKGPVSASEKIIIYKILGDQNGNVESKEIETNPNSVKNIVKSLTSIDKVLKKSSDEENGTGSKVTNKKRSETLMQSKMEHIDEGLYKKVNQQWESEEANDCNDGEEEDPNYDKSGSRCRCRRHGHTTDKKDKSISKEPLQLELDQGNTSTQRSSTVCDQCKSPNVAEPRSSTNAENTNGTKSAPKLKLLKTDKCLHPHSELGLIKLMEDDVDQSNKFYVGASGVLKDEDYEVIIQLRKKHQKDNEKSSVKEVIERSRPQKQTTVESEGISGTNDKSPQDLPIIASEKRDFLPSEDRPSVPNVYQTLKEVAENKKAITKATNTSQFRPTNIACTQTSGRNSPENRSVFVQMSSSTSTTYMSPPERVLPRYLKSGTATRTNHIDIVSPQMSCRDKKCKNTVLKPDQKVMKRQSISRKIETAINIAASDGCHTYSPRKLEQIYSSNNPPHRVKKKVAKKCTHHKSLETPNEGKTKCSHTVNDAIPNMFCRTCVRIGRMKNRNVNSDRSEKCLCKTAVPLSSCRVSLQHSENQKNQTVRKQTKKKSQLNPVIKNYVHELLNLNKDGLKALEIAALQCSSVTTPGSSVINEPSNNAINNYDESRKAMLTKLENILNLEKLRMISTKHRKSYSSLSSDNNFKMPSKVRYSKKKINNQKSIHKIKHLNISKTVVAPKKNLNGQRKEHHSLTVEESSDNNAVKKMINEVRGPRPKSDKPKARSISTPSPRTTDHHKLKRTITASDITQSTTKQYVPKIKLDDDTNDKKSLKHTGVSNRTSNVDNITVTTAPNKITIILKPPIEVKPVTKQFKDEIVNNKHIQVPLKHEIACNTRTEESVASGTQTNWANSQEIELVKFAQSKLQNMEKIANLTDKCTKRLSSLAKVLEEVRKNKSTAYSHISTTDTSSETELKADKNDHLEHSKTDLRFQNSDSVIEAMKRLETLPLKSVNKKTDYIERTTENSEVSFKNNDHSKKYNETNTEEIDSSKYVRTDTVKCGDESLVSTAINTDKVGNFLLYSEGIKYVTGNESQSIISTAINTDAMGIPVDVSVNTDNRMEILNNNNISVSTAMNTEDLESTNYVPMLSDIPKPLKVPSSFFLPKESTFVQNVYSTVQSPVGKTPNPHSADVLGKPRSKPPPALSRVILKKSNEILIPHELSTVIEVDSPMSVKYKKQSPSLSHPDDSKQSQSEMLTDNLTLDDDSDIQVEKQNEENKLFITGNVQKSLIADILKESSQLKMQMMDLTKFNEIMLKPFITVEEYAKQCNVGLLDEGSTHEELSKAATNDEISSLNSDGSLPDVIAELIKRNVISEPFKFDSASNSNSITLSSESSLPVLALSKGAKEKRKAKTVQKNKERVIISETSDTLSVSSYPDLESAFKKLGMGWASSTLKKTKQTLALSSSTSTSNSSTSYKYSPKKYDKVVGALGKSREETKPGNDKEDDRKKQNVEQQTSMAKSMTVKEFLANELADKMTFSNKSNINESEEHFTSLYSTKLPNETNLQMTCPSAVTHSGENVRSNTRQRTSTPVQMFKSTSYNSSSSSNNRSDGLFSNADDLSSVKMTSSSVRNHSSSEKDELTIPNYSLRVKKDNTTDGS